MGLLYLYADKSWLIFIAGVCLQCCAK